MTMPAPHIPPTNPPPQPPRPCADPALVAAMAPPLRISCSGGRWAVTATNQPNRKRDRHP